MENWPHERSEAGVVRAAVDVVRGAVAQVGLQEAESLDGPAPAVAFLDALADRLAIGVASVVAILDPGCVVLGGEVGRAGGAELAARVQDRIGRMTPLPTEVRATTLGGGAVLRGALLTARDRAQEELFEPGGAGRPDGGQGPSSPSPGRSVGLSRPGDDPRKD